MTGADDERSGRGIVQLQSISSPDTDPPEPPEPSVPPVPPEPPPEPPPSHIRNLIKYKKTSPDR